MFGRAKRKPTKKHSPSLVFMGQVQYIDPISGARPNSQASNARLVSAAGGVVHIRLSVFAFLRTQTTRTRIHAQVGQSPGFCWVEVGGKVRLVRCFFGRGRPKGQRPKNREAQRNEHAKD